MRSPASGGRAEHRISVVLPVFDRERYVGDAVRSVLGQSRPADELVVIDDGSTDGSMDVVRAFASPKIRILAQPNGGIGSARNLGVAAAAGELVAFLDSDDIWEPEKLAVQERALEANGVPLVFGHLVEFLSPDRRERLAGVFELADQPTPGLCASTLLARREALERIGPFDTTFRVGEFIDWLARAADLGMRHVVVPETVARRRVHGDNSVLTRGHSDYLRVLKRAIDRRRGGTAHGS